ncbi:unnamed protein product [Tilletia controversa]|uniref:CID domain-containing protein n=3 Tax=Tilletia TaxID=13289 RepID=A0A8X7SWA5_9BASI|nr:hypothetical protein CF336_g5694 [Tilletia laevis]KAE8205517.1 hypothetical protein CF328_g464 [Tilletia controversa]KAE8265432.1 hypothetical protein A4X03_0g274 [Tilletia caries]KAE8195470.1 hypothetical protein CF335_g5092 [Tilletia laevis]KAE8246474.1 hypothetical protein A4X06_0g4999 [Tilletia controversa]
MYGRQQYHAPQQYAGHPPQHGYQRPPPPSHPGGSRHAPYPPQHHYPPPHQAHHGQYAQYPPHQYAQHQAPPAQYAQPPPPQAAPTYQLHPMVAHDPQAFEQMFRDQLASLTFNSKPIITHLTILANDHVAKMQTVICNAIEQHIFTAPIPMRLPAMYLVDSMSKNIGPPYTSNWSGIITRLFLETYRVVDAPTRKRLEELLATWRQGGPQGTPLFGESAQWTIERSLYGTQQHPQGLAHQLAAKDNEAIRSPQVAHGQLAHAGLQDSRSALGHPVHAQPGHAQHAHHHAPPPQAPAAMSRPDPNHGHPPTSHAPPSSGSAANNLIQSLLQAGLLAQEATPVAPSATETDQDDAYVRAIMSLDLSLTSGPSDWVKGVQTQMQMQGMNTFDPLELVLHHRGMPATCKQCANRYSASKEGRKALDEHLDWHFRQNRRAKDSAMRGQSRSWFTGVEVWVRSGFDDTAPSSSGGDGGADGSRIGRTAEEEAALRATYQATVVVAPTDAEVAAKPCPICQEKFQSEWSEDDEDWIWRNAVQVDGVYQHASCHASAKVMSEQVNRSGTPEVEGGSRASTPRNPLKALPSNDPVTRVKAEEGVPTANSLTTLGITDGINPRKRKESPAVAEAAVLLKMVDPPVKRERISD